MTAISAIAGVAGAGADADGKIRAVTADWARDIPGATTLPNGVTLIPLVKSDVSPPLRSIEPLQPGPQREMREIETNPEFQSRFQPLADPVVQRSVGRLAMPAATTFEGDDTEAGTPPDTNGDIGLTQYVETVNTSFEVFSRAGTVLYGPATINTLFTGFGGGCQNNNDGDPVVKYDRRADRWIVSQFSVTTTPYLQCVAVSQTNDATGAWYRYSYSFGNTNFNDYPKIGVWPDAYYFAFNIFAGGASFSGAMACAFDRTNMLTNSGVRATQCFGPNAADYSMLPSDLDGPTDPPAGSNNYFLQLNTGTTLRFRKFHVDFATPANTTFSAGTNITVAAFTQLCGGGTCVPQQGTAQQNDSLADRLMYRLGYRNMGGYESLVVTHSVSAGGGGGIRWYEIRSPATTPTVFQQGTFAPDASYRWMGSVAMDHMGDIAAGYSISSSAMHPSINYAGRLVGDPAGLFSQGEATMFTGPGSNTGPYSRWGDYSAMQIDPADDCTFWYVQEYYPAAGNSFSWHTRVGHFKFPSCAICTPPAPPTAGNNGPICAGATLNLTASTVAGATYSWTGPNGFTSTLQNPSIANATTAATGIYSVTATVSACTSSAGTTTATVNPVPAAPTASNNGPICAGATLNLTASTVAGATYSWTGPNGFTSTLQNPSIANATTAATGTYSVTATVSACTSSAGTTTATVNPVPAAPTASNNGPICAGATLNLTASTVAGATYSWTGPNGFTSTLQNPSIANATTAATGTYSVRVTVSGCTSLAGTTTATVNATPAAPTASNNGPICAGATLNLTASTVAGATYSWTGPNGFTSTLQNPSIANATTAATGTYSVRVTVSGCQSAAGTTTATVNATPAAPTASNNGPICAGATLNLTASTVAGATYSWTGPNGFTSTLQNPSIANATTAATGTYSVTVTVSGCTSFAGTTTSTVNATPAAPTITPVPASVCASSTGNQASGPAAATTYAWTIGNGTITSAANLQTITYTAGASGSVTLNLTVTNASACPASNSANVTINPNPDATVTAPSSVLANSTGNTASIPVTAGATYAWTIVNGTITAGAVTDTITFTAGASGTVDLSVTVTASGCSSTGNQSVTINPVGTVLRFFTIAPCRLIDTRRAAGTYGGPALQGGTTRDFPLDGQCGIPADAYAVSANVTAVIPSGRGDVRAYSTGTPVPSSSIINFNAGRTRANNVLVALTGSPLGSMTIQTDILAGSTHFLFDVNGYFRFASQ
jgi:hypothetical protein